MPKRYVYPGCYHSIMCIHRTGMGGSSSAVCVRVWAARWFHHSAAAIPVMQLLFSTWGPGVLPALQAILLLLLLLLASCMPLLLLNFRRRRHPRSTLKGFQFGTRLRARTLFIHAYQGMLHRSLLHALSIFSRQWRCDASSHAGLLHYISGTDPVGAFSF